MRQREIIKKSESCKNNLWILVSVLQTIFDINDLLGIFENAFKFKLIITIYCRVKIYIFKFIRKKKLF